MYNVKLLNKISPVGLSHFNPSLYQVSDSAKDPDAILVRSADMFDMEIPPSLLAVARAGVGVNNIPVDEFSKRGIVVFNTPGANANAVKELVVAALILSSRRISEGIEWVKTLKGNGDDIPKLVEEGKAAFKGPELTSKKLGVIGLGAVGAMVANAADSLGMEVYGYDPYVSVEAAWLMSRTIKRAPTMKAIFSDCDYISLHIPYTPDIASSFSKEFFENIKPGVRLLNFARAELINDDDLLMALDTGKISCYVTDFPNEKILSFPNVVAIPHLGASTPESEDNCALMAAKQITSFLECGIIKNSVNFPNVEVPKESKYRVCLIHKNIPSMLSQISAVFAHAKINIEHLTNKSRGDYAFSFVDINDQLPSLIYSELKAIDGMITIREIR